MRIPFISRMLCPLVNFLWGITQSVWQMVIAHKYVKSLFPFYTDKKQSLFPSTAPLYLHALYMLAALSSITCESYDKKAVGLYQSVAYENCLVECNFLLAKFMTENVFSNYQLFHVINLQRRTK